jgi:two-component system, sensor histidine kinase and response regulator
MLTALAEQSDRNAGLDAGADDFITKPFDKRELQLRVQAFLRLRAQDLTIRSQRDLLHRLHSLKDDLISLLVHDLRNPLTGVLGILSVLHHGARNEEERVDIEMAQRSAERLRKALDDMLQIRLLEEGKLTAKRERTASKALVEEALTFADGVARERGIQIQRMGDEGTVNVDGSLVVRALENLVANAVKHAPKSTEIVLETRIGEDARVTFAVHDRGPGVPDSAKETLFQKFGALDPDAPRERRGFGLGLYLVDLVARAHDGAVEVRDRPGGGATFSLTLSM